MPPPSNFCLRSPILTRFRAALAIQNSTMPGDEHNHVVKHSVITTPSNVPKFSGEPDTIDLHQYIKRIDTLITNKGITEDNLKIECFKEHIDNVKGTARHVIAYSHLDSITTFDEYLKAFKKHFTTKSDRDPIRAMVKYLKTTPESNESHTAFISRLDAQAQDIETIFENSQWVVSTDKKKISIKNMALVMMLAQIVKSNSGIVQERLYKDIKPDIQLGEVDCLLNGYAEIDPSCKAYVLNASTDSRSSNTHRQGRSQSRGRSSTPHRGRSPSRQRNMIECYTCHKLGHSSKECYANVTCGNCQYRGHRESVCRNPPWCNYHNKIGHRTTDCRARNPNFSKGHKEKAETT